MKVMIGYDGSESAREAIRELQRAGLPGDTDAMVATVADIAPGMAAAVLQPAADVTGWPNAPMAHRARALAEQSLAEASELAAEGASRLKAEFPRWTVSHATYAGSPYGELIKPPPDGSPDLIVVGSQGRSALGRLVLGSVSQNVLIHAPCSVRISRRPAADVTPRGAAVRIIVGIDGSEHSALAVSAVAGRAWPSGTEVKVIAALDVRMLVMLATPTPSPWARPWRDAAPRFEDARQWASEAVDEVVRELRAAGLEATAVVEEADPKKLLIQEAERWSADCIFLGAKGLSALERFLLGSVSASVATRAQCAVEVVRQG